MNRPSPLGLFRRSEGREVHLKQHILIASAAAALALGIASTSPAQEPAAGGKGAPRVAPEDNRPPLFFRAEWKRPKEEGNHLMSTADVSAPNVEMQIYGDKNINETLHAIPKTEGTYAWTGLCEASCALTLRDKNNYVDLSGPMAKLRWKSKQAGFHMLRPVIKLADGTMLVAEYADGYTADWRESDISIAGMRWRPLDPKTALTTGNGNWVTKPDLTKVDEVGFTDLMAGAGHGAGGSSRVSWIEVYGNPVKRDSGASQTTSK